MQHCKYQQQEQIEQKKNAQYPQGFGEDIGTVAEGADVDYFTGVELAVAFENIRCHKCEHCGLGDGDQNQVGIGDETGNTAHRIRDRGNRAEEEDI